MAVCNLFKKLSNTTGEFIMFSQYAEDLTRNNSQGYNYRVTPSKFIATDINFTKFANKYDTEKDLNISFPKYLQNYFENGCAYCKTYKGIEWNPNVFSNLFWNAMMEGELLTYNQWPGTSNDENRYYIDEFKWIGDINLQSYDEKRGMGYSEIYCYIPNSAASTRYGCTKYTQSNALKSINDVVEGYKEADFTDDMISGAGVSTIPYYPNQSIDFYHNKQEYGISVLNEDKFNVNCIIVMYDIYNIDDDGNSNTIYKNIPLGIYLPGNFEGNNVKNPITKWTHNSTIYNSGTSYGIRICSRFSVSPNVDNIKITDVNSIDSDEYTSLSQVMGGIADNLNEMMNITKDAVFDSTALKETLAIFKDSRTNVPYEVDLNGTKYWFVNGRNTGIKIPDGSQYDSYTKDQMKDALIMWDGVDTALSLVIYSTNKQGEKIYFERTSLTGDQKSEPIYFKWEMYDNYNYTPINPDELKLTYPDGSIEELNPDSKYNIIEMTNIKDDGQYKLTALLNLDTGDESDTCQISYTYNFKFCLPIYFGFVGSIDNQSGSNNADSIISDIIQGFQNINNVNGVNKFILPTESNRILFTSSSKRMIYAYPKEYGELSVIINRNNMDDSMDDFEREVINVDFNGESKEYYLYYTTNSAGEGVDTTFDFVKSGYQINDIVNYQIKN